MQDFTPDYLAIAEAITQKKSWKEALDSVIAVVRSIFIFDNLALFLADEESDSLTKIVYARAVGRGQSAGADAAWGVEVANQIIAENAMVLREPLHVKKDTDRLLKVYLLGFPLRTADGVVGALIFVRFGGPPYEPDQVQRGQYIATQFAGLFEHKKLRENINALEEARHLLALQDDFIATISHELRTPLGFIKGYSTTLLRQDTQWDDETRREFLTIIDEEADHLSVLIENILESSRLQSNTLPMHFQPIRLDILLREAAARSQARYQDMKVTLDIAKQFIAPVDSVRLAQVFGNLFSNAAKYAPGAPITVSVFENNRYCRIRFSDAGPGVPPEHVHNLFQRFYRVPGQGGSGTGLGLFICRKIIEAHNGRISVESMPGQGTTFIIDLPIVPDTRS